MQKRKYYLYKSSYLACTASYAYSKTPKIKIAPQPFFLQKTLFEVVNIAQAIEGEVYLRIYMVH